MNAKQRDALIESYFKEDMKLLRAKGHDYSGDQDCLRNLARHGLKGIIVRLGDKYERLNTLVWEGSEATVSEEGLAEIFRDISNYCYLGRVILAEKNWKPQMPFQKYVINYHRAADGTGGSIIVFADNANNAVKQFPYSDPGYVIDEVYPKSEEREDSGK